MNKSSNRPWIDQLLCTYSWEHSKWIWMYLGDTLVQKVPGGWHISHSLGTKDYKKPNLAIPLPVVYTIKVGIQHNRSDISTYLGWKSKVFSDIPLEG